MKRFFVLTTIFGGCFFGISDAQASSGMLVTTEVVINEIAWMGTQASNNDEWIELYNFGTVGIDLTGWKLEAVDGAPSIQLSGFIAAESYFLLERSDDNTISDVPAHLIYTGSMSNNGEHLMLIDPVGNVVDEVLLWYAGDNESKASMERVDPLLAGTDVNNWETNNSVNIAGTDAAGNPIIGTPGSLNSTAFEDIIIDPPTIEIPSYDIILNEFSFHNSEDFVELVCLDCPTEGADLAGYSINETLLGSGTFIFPNEYLLLNTTLDDESGMIKFSDPLGMEIWNYSYGIGNELDQSVYSENSSACTVINNFAIGRTESGSSLRPLNAEYEFFHLPTPGYLNKSINRSPQIQFDINKWLFGDNKSYILYIDSSDSCDPDGDPLTYEWDIDGDIFSDESTIEYITSSSGTIIIGLTVTDSLQTPNSQLQTFFLPTPKDINIRINEINYDDDWIEIYCEYCAEGIYSDNFKILKNESTSTYFKLPVDQLINTGDYILINLRQDTDRIESSEGLLTIDSTKTGLGTSGSLHLAFTNRSEIEDSISWEKKPTSDYFSFGKDENGVGSWSSTQTPGSTNIFTDPAPDNSGGGGSSGPSQPPAEEPDLQNLKLRINEVFMNPEGADTNAEFVELYNAGDTDLDLSGWKLDDILDGGSKPYILKNKTIIKARGFLTLFQKNTGILLNNDTDSVFLLSPDDVIADSIQYSGAKEELSYSLQEGGGFEWTSFPTPKTTNQFDEEVLKENTSKIIISEVFPNPAGPDADKEFVTLYNNTDFPIDLHNWILDNKEGGSSPFLIQNITLDPRKIHIFQQNFTGLQLTNSFDQIRLFDPNYSLIDIFGWKNAIDDKIYHRDEFGEYDLGTVVNAVDGDTVDILFDYGKEKRIRLIGVDAPESVHPEKEPEYFGPESSEYTKSKLTDKNVKLRYESEKEDVYNRTLAYIYLEDETLFNGKIIEDGYAFAYTRFPFHFHEKFSMYEDEARSNKRGMWADEIAAEEVQEEVDEELIEKENDTEETETMLESSSGTYVLSKNIFISEIYPAPSSGEEEFIELFNSGNKDIDLFGWQLDDILEDGSNPYTFPLGSIIRAGEFLVVKKSVTKINMNNSGDEVYLIDPTGNVVERIAYDKAKKGKSYAKNFESGIWHWTNFSPGKNNPPPEVIQMTSKQDRSDEIEKKTRMHKYQLYKTKGLVLKGRTIADSLVALRIDGGNEMVVTSDEFGYFELQYLQPLTKGSHSIDITVIDEQGISWSKQNIQTVVLDEDYYPPKKKASTRKSKSSKSSKSKYKYVNIQSGSDGLQGTILAVFADQQALLIENEEKSLILASYEDFDIAESNVERFFVEDETIKMAGKWNNNVFYIEQFEKVEEEDKDEGVIREAGSVSWLSYEIGIFGVMMVFGGGWAVRSRWNIRNNQDTNNKIQK